jgi:DNA-binding LacI/PurR family transcriptional regulator/predicted transcriptional regulator
MAMRRSVKAWPGETRREAILDVLRRDGSVRVSELTESTGVTPVTIRRDIAQLEEEGIVRRVHGGAILIQERSGEPLNDADGQHGGSGRIGMIVPSLDYYWPGVIEGAQQEAAKHGLTVVLRGSSYEADDILPHVEYLLSRAKAAGLILAPNMGAAHSVETLELLATRGVPAVLVERTAVVGPFHTTVESVVSDHSQGAAIAMRYLAALGHRRIGLVISGDSPTGPHIRQGWLRARQELGIDDLQVVDETVPNSRESSWGATVDVILDECLALGTTALLVHADQAAASITQGAEARGLSVPGDLSVIAYDDEVAELFTPPVTAIRPPRGSLGRAAVNLVAERIRNPDRPAHSIVITPSLRVRKTTGSPR